MIKIPYFCFPYSIGVNDTVKGVPSDPCLFNVPLFGNTEKSESDSGVKNA